MRPHPTPQKRQGVFCHLIFPEEGSTSFQAPKLIPGYRTAAAAIALLTAAALMNALLVISMPHPFVRIRGLLVHVTEGHAQALKCLQPPEPFLELFFGFLVRRVGDEHQDLFVLGRDRLAVVYLFDLPEQVVHRPGEGMGKIAENRHFSPYP